ncbi:influenza virus NS1A-binding protein homolog A-like isoform X2 [Tubulanus polymorphus]
MNSCKMSSLNEPAEFKMNHLKNGTSQMMNGDDDDAEVDGAAHTERKNAVVTKLTFQDQRHHSDILQCLNTLRKNGQYCDVTLEVGSHEICAHKAVLASSSRYLMELFSLDESVPNSHYKLNNFDYKHFDVLVNYVYTGKLEVEEHDIKSVYKMAMRLKMVRAAEACSNYLADNLNAMNCIGIRSFASGFADASLTKTCDEYIKKFVTDVATSNDCMALPRIQVEVIGADEVPIMEKDDNQVDSLVVDWIREALEEQPTWECLTDHVNVLYLASDNVLRDCKDLDTNELRRTEYIKDYQNMCKKRQITPSKTKESSHRRHNNNSINVPRKIKLMSGDIDEKPAEPEWRVLATAISSEKKRLCIAMLDNQLATISIHYRPTPAMMDPGTEKNGSASPEISPRQISADTLTRQMSLVLLAPMSVARSGLGVALLKDNIVAMGGYDRGECYAMVEQYDLSLNKWFPLKSMTIARGRFDACSLNGKLYACGGSNSRTELRSLECFDPVSNEWSSLADMRQTRASTGLATLNGKLYCIGGNCGQGGMKSCECYDPNSNSWSDIAQMNQRRSESGVCALNGVLYAVGGCDSWNCLNSVEMYVPQDNTWKLLPSMTSCRRGAGVAAFDGKIYVIGGSDGNSVQQSVEIFDPATQSWSNGPMMVSPRVSVGAIVVGNRLFAVGGFNGKLFLNTAEYLNLELNEWCSYLPTNETRCSGSSSSSSSEKH